MAALNVIGYFSDRFHYPTTAFNWDTDVRNAFNFDATNWAELADQFNRLGWMIQIHVLLAQREMGKLNTIGDLTSLICDKLRKERSFAAALPGDATLPKAGSKSTRKKRL